VTLASWRKYPNDMTPHVVNVDIINRGIDQKTGVLRTERLITCKQNIPDFVRRVLGGENVAHVLEVSEVDPRTRTMVLRSRNLSMNQLIDMEEVCTYQIDNQDDQRTCFKQEVKISVFGVSLHMLRSRVEEFCLNRFKMNAMAGRLGMEQVIQKVVAERMTSPTALV
jgi:hypothetical protein